MRILILSQWYDPEPTIKGQLFAEQLKKRGYSVEVLTGFPNYPGGNIYPGYKIKFYQKELINGIKVHRSALYPSHDKSVLKRIFCYISFFISSLFVGMIKIKDVDLIYSYHPPITTCLTSIILGKIHKVPVVIDIQDLWPDSLYETNAASNRLIVKLITKITNYVYKKASKIVVLSPGFKRKIHSLGIPMEKIEVIYNWANEEALLNFEYSDLELPKNNKKNVVFAGNIGLAQGITSILEAARILKRNGAKINLVFVGDGVAKNDAIESAKKYNLHNVFFMPRVPMNQVGGILKQADALLVHLKNKDLFEITIPSKIQSYMCIGKPIIIGVKGDARKLIEDSESGFYCTPDNPSEIARIISMACDMGDREIIEMSDKATSYYQKNLSLEAGVNKFDKLFRELL